MCCSKEIWRHGLVYFLFPVVIFSDISVGNIRFKVKRITFFGGVLFA
jgi:hypothetical protein